MDEPQNDDLCPNCDSRLGDQPHDCAGRSPDATPQGGETSGESGDTWEAGEAGDAVEAGEGALTERIIIPAGLWETGLFKTVSARPSTEPVLSGSLLSRPADLDGADAVSEDAVSEDAAETEEDADETSELDTAAPTEGSDAVEPEIDDSVVVPAFLVAAAEGRVLEDDPAHVDVAEGPSEDESVAESSGVDDVATDSTEDGTPLAATSEATQPMPVVSAIQANDTAVEAAQESGDEPATDDPAGEVPATDDSAADDSAAEDSAAEDSAAEDPATDDPTTDHLPGDPEAARAALLAILYPGSDPIPAASMGAAPIAAAPDETPTSSDETPTSPAEPDAPTSAPTSLAALRHMDEDDYVDDEDAEERPRGRLALVGISVLVILVAAAGGGWFWWQHQQDAPVRDAFATSHSAFVTAAQGLEEASTLDDVAGVGSAFGELTDEFDATTKAAEGSSSDVAVAARRATLAEREVAIAGATLAELSADDFSPWLEARDSLTTALEGLDSVRGDVTEAGGDADDLPGADLAEQVAALIGSQAAKLAVEKTDMMLADLGKVKRVADVRAVGTDAAGSADALRTVADGIDAEGETALADHTELHSQLGKLARLKPDNLASWPRIRDRLITDIAFLEDSAAAEKSIAHADKTLLKATKTWETWKQERAEAKDAKKADLEALTEIEETMERVSSDYASLDFSLGALIRRGNTLESNGREGDAYKQLAQAAYARERLRDSIAQADVPALIGDELTAIADPLGANATSVRAAAAAAATCAGDCVLTDTAGWNNMVRSRIGQGARFKAAVEAFKPALEEAREEITDRKLPKRPKI